MKIICTLILNYAYRIINIYVDEIFCHIFLFTNLNITQRVKNTYTKKNMC